MADIGFLDSLGLGATDPRAVATAVRESKFSAANQQGAAFGRQAAPLLGAGVGAVTGLITGENDGRSLKGALFNARESAQFLRDQEIAQANGIDVQTYRSNQRIKAEAARKNFGPADTYEARIKAAEFVANEAAKDGNITAKFQALQVLDQLKIEQAEFQKLQAQEKRAERESIFDDIQDIFLKGSNKPISARRVVLPDGTIAYEYVDENGNPQAALPGEFSFENPDLASQDDETLDQRWRRIVNATDRSNVRKSVSTIAGAIPRYRRVMENVRDLSGGKGAQIVLSDSGRIVQFFDRTLRNVKGVGQAILTIGDSKDNRNLQQRMRDRAKNLDDSVWTIDFPPEFKRAAAASESFRAQIMELAYLAARMSEPSNRGLSDTDVERALERLAVGSSNPQTIMRRFVELIADGARDVEDQVATVTTVFGPEFTPELEQLAAGSTLKRYRKERDQLYEDFDITIDPLTNRATFAESIDVDVQPGEGVPVPVNTDELSDDEFLNQVLGQQ